MKSAFQELIDEKERLRPKNTKKNYDPKRKLWQVFACFWLCRHVFGIFCVVGAGHPWIRVVPFLADFAKGTCGFCITTTCRRGG
jgi:hypothetical protein